MNQQDKLRYIESVEKSLTSECFQLCFNKQKLLLDFQCVSTCYHKYIFTMGEIQKIIEEEGRYHYSDFVANSVGLEKKDRFKEEVFPIGGHPLHQEGLPLRRKYFESYMYSNPFKYGR